MTLVVVIVAASALFSVARSAAALDSATVLLIGAHAAAWMLLSGIAGNEGTAREILFLVLIAACWLLAWRCVTVLCEIKPASNWSKARSCAC